MARLSAANASAPDLLPDVRIEVRSGASRTTSREMTSEEFLVGSVPGCDYRLPGTNLPPVVCIISRQTDGVRLRKVAPTLPIFLNGQPVTGSGIADLNHGDTVSIGPIDLYLTIERPAAGYTAPAPRPVRISHEEDEDRRRQEEYVRRTREAEDMARQLEDRARKLNEREEELEGDRVLWYRRRDEIEREMTHARDAIRQARDLEAALMQQHADIAARESALVRQAQEVRSLDQQARQRQETENQRLRLLEQSEDQLVARRRDLEAEYQRRRQELEIAGDVTAIRATIEREMTAKLRDRSNELDRIQNELTMAGLQLRDRRDAFEASVREWDPRVQEVVRRETAVERLGIEHDRRAAELERFRETTLIDRGAFEEKQRQLVVELTSREGTLAAQMAEHAAASAALREDLLRLDRLGAELETREASIGERAGEIDSRVNRIHLESGEFESQAREIDRAQEQNRVETARLVALAVELKHREASLLERTTQVETQQSMLTALRMNLENRREETRLEAEGVAGERARVDTIAAAAQEQLREAEMLRLTLSSELGGHDETRQALDDRATLLQEAVTRVRDLQAELAAEDARIQAERLNVSERETALLALAAAVAERESLAQSRTEQLVEMQSRLEDDRKALRDREAALTDIDDSRNNIQESLRKRSEELALRQRELDTRHDEFTALVGGHETSVAELDRHRAELEARRLGNEQREAHWQLREGEYQSRLVSLDRMREQIEAERAAFVADRDRFASEIERKTREANGGDELHAQRLAELEAERDSTRKQVAELAAGLPELELRTRGILDRLGQSRDQLRGQLSELHTYARQSQEELEVVRTSIASESERLRMQETSLGRARAEHRLSVASFRQQLIEWQGRFTDMKSVLTTGEARLERKQTAVEETARLVARQAESISEQQRLVAEKRSDIERHLGDMREWYRRKLRELVGTRAPAAEGSGILPLPPSGEPTEVESLAVTGDIEEGDRRLGELLLRLELVDQETVNGLWTESKRQRRPLRQILLSGGYLTLYQLALIEAGNIHRLVLGRFRVIDRLSSSARETVFRVFDPQTIPSSGEWNAANTGPGTRLLRHLGESEMSDAVRPDEYRQRFTAVRDVAHPNIAPTLEILEINGRPAIVQEWLGGVPGGDWPSQTSSPWVWYRLLSQTAQGLHTAHQAQLYHGRLSTSSLLLNSAGSVRILGLGEPPWLYGGIEGSVEGDLRDLGQIALFWMNNGRKRGTRTKFPEALVNVLRALGASPTEEAHETAMYPNVAALLEDLDGLDSQMNPDNASWEKLLGFVRDNLGGNPGLKLAA